MHATWHEHKLDQRDVKHVAMFVCALRQVLLDYIHCDCRHNKKHVAVEIHVWLIHLVTLQAMCLMLCHHHPSGQCPLYL